MSASRCRWMARRRVTRPPSGSRHRSIWRGPCGATCWNVFSSAPDEQAEIQGSAGSETPPHARTLGSRRRQGSGAADLAGAGGIAALPGRPRRTPRARRPATIPRPGSPDLDDLPAVSIAHAEGVAVALAVRLSRRSAGDRRRRDRGRDPSDAFTPHERTLLAQAAKADAPEWAARFGGRQASRGQGRRRRPRGRVGPRPRREASTSTRESRRLKSMTKSI